MSEPFYSEEGFTPNKDYLADTAPIDPSGNPAASAATKSVNDIHSSQRAFLNGIARTESGFNTKEAYADYLNTADTNANVRKYGDIGADYGYYQNNGLDVQDAIRLGVDPDVAQHLNGGGKNGTSTLDQQTLAMHEYVSRKYPSSYENLKT